MRCVKNAPKRADNWDYRDNLSAETTKCTIHVPREIHGAGFPSESLAPGLNCGAPGGLTLSGGEKEGKKTAARECTRGSCRTLARLTTSISTRRVKAIRYRQRRESFEIASWPRLFTNYYAQLMLTTGT